jgi:hypothetical protein
VPRVIYPYGVAVVAWVVTFVLASDNGSASTRNGLPLLIAPVATGCLAVRRHENPLPQVLRTIACLASIYAVWVGVGIAFGN